ncbi:uncharacterized protein [Palaemon carinicauda]|uniref:uncharacterized protein n=1 Tax=Palaemon carinicauda TaxID=392227 RepID=UPI0035B6A232
MFWLFHLLLINYWYCVAGTGGRSSRDASPNQSDDMYDYLSQYQYDWDYEQEEEQKLDFGTIRQNQVISLKPSCKHILYYGNTMLSNSSLSSEEFPEGSLPSEEFPEGLLPLEEFPEGSLPSEEFPEGLLPSEEFPEGSLPSEEFPEGSLPSEEFPEGSLPSEEFPEGSLPSEEFPEGSLPVAGFSNSSFLVSEYVNSALAAEEFSNSPLPGSKESTSDHRKDGGNKFHKKGNKNVKQAKTQENCLYKLIKNGHLQALTWKYVSLYSYEQSFTNVMNMSNVLLIPAIMDANSSAICIPFIKSCTSQSCDSQVSQCNEIITGNQKSGSKDVGRLSDISSINKPRQVKSCPEKIFPQDSTTVEVSNPIAVILTALWSTDRLLSEHCESLLCSSKIYDFWRFLTFTVILNSTDIDSACLRDTSRHSILPRRTEGYSIDLGHAGKHLLFLAGNMSQVDDFTLEFLSYIDFAKNYGSEDQHCCTQYIEHSYHFISDRRLIYCYSLEDSCKSLPYLWKAIEVDYPELEDPPRDYFIMRPDVVHLNISRSLAPLIGQFPSSNAIRYTSLGDYESTEEFSDFDIYKYFINLDYNNTSFGDYEIWVGRIKSQEVNMRKLTLELERNHFDCRRTKYYCLCSKDHTILIYLLEGCISTYLSSDELFFLLLSHYLNQKYSNYLCQNNSSVIMTTSNEAYTSGHTLHFMILPFDIHQGFIPEPQILYKGVFQVKNSFTEGFEHTPFSNYIIQISKLFINDNILLPTIKPSEADTESFMVMAKLFNMANVNNNTRCIQDVLEKRFSYERNVSEKILYLVGPVYDDPSESKCLLDISHKDLLIDKNSHSLTMNKFWPTCFTNMLMAIKNDGTRAADWDYLPFKCKVQESLLLCLIIVITLVTVIGNLFVMTILVASGLIQKQPFLIRFSLSLSDLLNGTIPSSLAIFDSIALMTGWLTLNDLSHSDTVIYFAEKTIEQTEGFQQLRFERQGFYHVFSSIIMSVSIFVSIFSLSLISIENLLVIKRRPLKRWQVKLMIGTSWFLGIAFSLLVQWREDGWSAVAYFDPITKLTLNIGASDSKLSSITFYIQVVLAGIGGSCVLILTVLSIITFRFQEHCTQKEMPIHQQGRQENVRQTTIIFLYMVALYALSSVPPLLDTVLDFSFSHPLLHFFSWWIFMAGSSMNWIIYAYKGKTFKKAVKKILSQRSENVSTTSNLDSTGK